MADIGDDMNTNEKKFTKPVVVMCEPAAVDRYDAFAKKVGMGRSEWIRDVLGKTTGDVRAIESAIGPPVVTRLWRRPASG